MRPSLSLCLPHSLSHFMNLQVHFVFICSPPQGVVLEMPGRPNIVCFHFIFFHFCISSYLLPSFQIAAKSISYSTLIRIGVLWGIGPGAYEKGKFGDTWGCHSSQYIKKMYDALIQKLSGSNDDVKLIFAPFDALSLLIGDKNSRLFCQQDLGISARPPLSNTSYSRSN